MLNKFPKSKTIYHTILYPYSPSNIFQTLEKSNFTTDYLIITGYINYIDESISYALNERLLNKIAIISSQINFPLQVIENIHSTIVLKYPVTSYLSFSNERIIMNYNKFGEIDDNRVINMGICVNINTDKSIV